MQQMELVLPKKQMRRRNKLRMTEIPARTSCFVVLGRVLAPFLLDFLAMIIMCGGISDAFTNPNFVQTTGVATRRNDRYAITIAITLTERMLLAVKDDTADGNTLIGI